MNKDGAKIIMVKKSPWCNNIQLNNVRLTNFKMLVSQSISVVLR